MLKRNAIPKKLFSNLKTQEDLDAWLKLTKKKIKYAYFLNRVLTTWNSVPHSLSKNTFQKIKDLWSVINKQKKISLIRKGIIFINIVFNAIKRKL